MRKSSKGFTLIELLIVIALLGALAVGLLATVDPFEQLKKGTDTTVRNITTEVYNAMIRYYAIKSGFPWTSEITTPVALSDISMTESNTGYLSQVISAGELKPEFIQLASGHLTKIFVTSTENAAGQLNSIAVCFTPESKSFQNDPNTKFSSDGSALASGCKSQIATGTSCSWCVR